MNKWEGLAVAAIWIGTGLSAVFAGAAVVFVAFVAFIATGLIFFISYARIEEGE